MELPGGGRGIGYVLKTRVTKVDEFTETLERVVAGGSVVDPALVERLLNARRACDPPAALTARERDVLALMAEGGRTLASRANYGSRQRQSRNM
jgi:serine/threonine-protein kinase PknK